MTTRRFEHSFNPKTKPAAGEPCALKWHYNGVMRELVGYFDNMAAIDPGGERFVFTSVAYLLRQGKLKRYKGEAYSESAIRHALAELRARRIISKPLERERWMDARPRKNPDEVVPQVLRKLMGSIVAPHDCVTHMEDEECVFHGPMKCGRWDRLFDTEPAKQLDSEIFFVYDNTPSGVLYWAGCAKHGRATGGLPNGKQMLSAPNTGESAGPIAAQSAEQCAGYCAEPSAEHCAGSIAKPDSGQLSDVAEDSAQNGVQAVVTVMPVQPCKRLEPSNPEQPNQPTPLFRAAAQESKPGRLTTSQGGGACAPTTGHDVTKPLGSEVTIGQRFAIKEDIALLQEISDGEYNVYAYKDDITTLAEYTRMVVEEIAGVPWDGQRSTCAGMMDAVAKRMTRDRKEWPAGWLAVIKELRKGGPCHTQYTPPKPAHWVGFQDHEGPPNAPDALRHSFGDWELCFDWLRRDSAAREAAGYTAKADGVWGKP